MDEPAAAVVTGDRETISPEVGLTSEQVAARVAASATALVA